MSAAMLLEMATAEAKAKDMSPDEWYACLL